MVSCFEVYCCSLNLTNSVFATMYSPQQQQQLQQFHSHLHNDFNSPNPSNFNAATQAKSFATTNSASKTLNNPTTITTLATSPIQSYSDKAVLKHVHDYCRQESVVGQCFGAIGKCLSVYLPYPDENICHQLPSGSTVLSRCDQVRNIIFKDYLATARRMIPIFPPEILSDITNGVIDGYQLGNASWEDHDHVKHRLLSQERTLLWIYGVVIPIIAILGIAGNVITMVIMTRKEMKSCINTYLAGLSVFDAILLFMSLFIYPPIPFCYQHDDPFACTFSSYPLLITYPLSLISQTGSVWTCVVVSVDRFVAVCHPLRARSLCTVSRAKLILILVAGFSVLFNIPTFFEIQIKSNDADVGNGTSVNAGIGGVEPSSLRKNSDYQLYYKTYAYLIVMILIPLVLLVSLNTLVIRTISIAFKKRQRMTRQEVKERRATKMVVVLVSCFILMNFLAFVSNFIEAFANGWRRANFAHYMMMVQFANMFVTLNSAINFMIYCAMGKRFRRMFLKLFCCCFNPKYGLDDYSWLSQVEHDKSESSGIMSMRRVPSARYNRGKTSSDGHSGYSDQGSYFTDTLAVTQSGSRPESRRSQRSSCTSPYSNSPIPGQRPPRSNGHHGSGDNNANDKSLTVRNISLPAVSNLGFDFSQMNSTQRIRLLNQANYEPISSNPQDV